MFSFIKYSNAKDNVLTEYKLHFKYHEKIYFLNNVVINVNENGSFFNYENDISINIKDDFIIREYETEVCPRFSFYKSDIEDEYKLYENEDSSIRLKEYNEYYTFEIISSNGLKI